MVLDASNIHKRAGGGEEGFLALCALESALLALDWEVVVVADATLRHKIGTLREDLEELVEACGWIQVPKGKSADPVILAEAERLDAWVVSHDRFRDQPNPPARRLDPESLLNAIE